VEQRSLRRIFPPDLRTFLSGTDVQAGCVPKVRARKNFHHRVIPASNAAETKRLPFAKETLQVAKCDGRDDHSPSPNAFGIHQGDLRM
jgi:hypothetical protein